jgi:hypothetical protein
MKANTPIARGVEIPRELSAKAPCGGGAGSADVEDGWANCLTSGERRKRDALAFHDKLRRPQFPTRTTAMLDFPGFDERSAEIQESYRADFELARRMFSSWVHRPIDRWLFKSELPGEVLSLSYMLNIQACRQFRSVIELCKIGEGENANILARSLFETTLGHFFHFNA